MGNTSSVSFLNVLNIVLRIVGGALSLGATILNVKDDNNEEEEALSEKLKKLESVSDAKSTFIVKSNTIN